MSGDNRQEVTRLRRRRGVVRSSLTRLEKRLREIEAVPTDATTAHARELAKKLDDLETNFKAYHIELVDLLDENEELLEHEQAILDEHDDIISDVRIRINRLTTRGLESGEDSAINKSIRRLNHLEKTIRATQAVIERLPDTRGDISLIEQLTDQKTELRAVHTELLQVEEDAVQNQLDTHEQLEEILFSCFHTTRKLSKAYEEPSRPTSDPDTSSGVRLPKLSVPTFDGSLLNWRQFWDQFTVSVHNRTNLSNAEKLVYLLYALKDGSAKSIIEGLSQSGEEYDI